jgi:hypothetical protein
MDELKIGIVGLDTSHCKAFTSILNDIRNPHYVPGGRVVCAYPGGTELFSLSRNRVEGYTQELRDDFGVKMVPAIPELVQQVDAVLLESVDGRQHLEQFRQLAVGKPVFIDKPFATSSKDAEEIHQIAQKTGTPIMSCSSLRYASGISDLVLVGESVLGCETFGPAALLDDYPGLFWYGIHSAEVLFSMMGTGCRNVRLIGNTQMDIVVGEWEDGRLGVMRGLRLSRGDFGCVVHTDGGTHLGLAESNPPYYAVMLLETMQFFKTGVSPIPMSETLEIIAFLEAAGRSRLEDGRSIDLV